MSTFEQLTDTAAIDAFAVRWVVTQRAAAIRVRDSEYLASRYTDDAVTFGIAPPLMSRAGEAPHVAWLHLWFARFPGRIGYDVRDLTVSVADEAAFCVSHDEFTARSTGRRREVVRFTTTLGLRRVNGVWRIATEHLRIEQDAAGRKRRAEYRNRASRSHEL